MKIFGLLALTAILYFSPAGNVKGQAGDTLVKPTLKLLFIGDIMGHDSQIAAAYNDSTKNYDYTDVFRYIRPAIEGAEIAIGNLEVTLAGPPYKGYPQFSSPAALAAAASGAGVDILVTANNHSVDRGSKGIKNTIFRLDSLGIPHTGTYYDATGRDSLVPHIINKNGIKLALLNYTYGTNGIPVPPPVIVDLIDREVIASDIEKAKSGGTDGIIVFVHWGNEYDTLPSKGQTELADWLIGKGVSLVIGSHPHVIEPMILSYAADSLTNRLVMYSMGNFVSNQRKRYTDGGAAVSLTVTKTESGLRIDDASYLLTWVYTPVESGRLKFYVLPAAEYEENLEIPADSLSRSKMKLFLEDSRRLMEKYSLGVTEKK